MAPTAALVIIGNEILSGRTKDKNLNYLATTLGKVGIPLLEVRVVPDVRATIIAAVNAVRSQYDYVFTTGGIGPTHDDITAEAVAAAFGVPLITHPEALRRLETHYAAANLPFNAARAKMACVPEGASLIDNPISTAPGFCIGNVYVMAGVPSIVEAMVSAIVPTLRHGSPILSAEVVAYVGEGTIAAPLTDIQNAFPDVDIGSYPFKENDRLGTTLVLRSADPERLASAQKAVQTMVDKVIGNHTSRE